MTELFEAFPPPVRVCKHCEALLQLAPQAVPGMPVECVRCKTPGVLKVFPCGEPGCDCGGYLGVIWKGIDYARNESDQNRPTLESWLRQAFGKG